MRPTLHPGSQGIPVKALQDVLNFQIRRLQPLAVDGIFGPATKARLMEFQRANSLVADGVAGTLSNGKLFMVEVQPVTLAFVPRSVKVGSASGLRSPQLIPPLTLPGFKPPIAPPLIPVPQLQLFQLRPSSSVGLPSLQANGQTITMNITTPLRSDPLDPTVRSFRQAVALLDTLPQNFPFRAQIIGAIPDPTPKPESIGFGFEWGIKPTFDLTKVIGPPEFTFGFKANAGYTLKVISKPGTNGLQLGIFGKADFMGTFDYTSEKATSTPTLKLDGGITGGVIGRF